MSSNKAIRKLRLKEGDIVVVHDQETFAALSASHPKINFYVPIILAPNGIKRLSREYIQKVLNKPSEHVAVEKAT